MSNDVTGGLVFGIGIWLGVNLLVGGILLSMWGFDNGG